MKTVSKNEIKNLFFVIPAMVFYSMFMLVPVVKTFYYSLTDWNGASPVKNFVGLANYLDLLRDVIFWQSLFHNIIWIFATIAIPVVLGLILASVVSSGLTWLPGFFRVVYFIPAVLSSVVVAIIWDWIYNPSFGLLNTFLGFIGLESLQKGWLGEAHTVLASLIAVGNWSYFGFCMVIYIAGLQSIDSCYYEAAELEGVGYMGKFIHITVPLLRNVTTLLVLNSLIGSFKVFDLVYVMTKGGPYNASEVIATYMFRNAFTLNQVGYGAAVAIIMALIVILGSVPYLKSREE